MRSTFWPNRILERQSCQNPYTCPKFSSKRENSALFLKIVQNALFRSCAARFGQIKFVSVKLLKILTLASNSLQRGKTVRFSWKMYKTLFSGHAEHVLAKSHLWEWKLSKSSHWPQILSKTGKQCAFNENCRSCAARFGKIAFLSTKVVNSSHWPEILFKTAKQCAFHENCTKRSFQVMRSTSWPNRICERQSCQNRHTGLKFSPKRENSALFMKIVQNALFRSCAARFGQIKFVSVKVLKIVTLASNSLQNGKTGRVSWKLYKTLVSVLAKSHLWGSKLSKSSRWPPQNGETGRFLWKLYKFLFSGHAEYVLAKSHFGASKLSKSLHWPEILFKTRKQFVFHENCTKRCFQVMRSTSWPNRICERQSCQNRHTGLKFSPKRENSALFMKIVQIALFRSRTARFGQIAFWSVKVLKIVTLAWKALQNGNTMRFSWKLYKTLVLGHAQHVLGKSNLSESKLSKSSHWPQILSKKGKQCAFHENCTNCSFQVTNSTFWPNRILERQSSQNRHTGLKSSSKREHNVLFMKIVQNARFRSCATRFGQIEFFRVKVVKIVTLASNSLQKRENSALFMKIVKNPFFASCAARFAQIVFFRVKLLKIVRLVSNSLQNGKTVRFSWKLYKTLLFRSCAARFGQIAFLSVKVVKIVTLARNSRERGKTVRFSWKLYKTLVSGHAQHVLAKSNLWASKFSKSSHWPQILFKTGKQGAFLENCTKRSCQFWPNRICEGQSWQSRHAGLPKTGKQCAFHENCTNSYFQVMRSTFWPNRILERQSCQNRYTGLKFSLKQENSSFSMKIVQNALSRSCAARLGQIAFVSVKVVKIVTLASNSLQKGKTVRFSWKLYKLLFSGHEQHVLAKSHFGASKFSKSSHWPEKLFKTGTQCAFHKNCTKRSFQVMRNTFWANRICQSQSCQNRHTGLKFSPKKGKQCAFHENCKKPFFRLMRSTFCPNRIFQGQTSQNR